MILKIVPLKITVPTYTPIMNIWGCPFSSCFSHLFRSFIHVIDLNFAKLTYQNVYFIVLFTFFLLWLIIFYNIICISYAKLLFSTIVCPYSYLFCCIESLVCMWSNMFYFSLWLLGSYYVMRGPNSDYQNALSFILVFQ